MLRIILAIIAGFFVTGVLSTVADHICHTVGFFPPYGEPMLETFPLLVALLYRIIFNIAGAYVAALIAKDKAFKATMILGGIGTVLWLLGGIIMFDMTTAWYGIGGALFGIPCCWAGYKIYERTKKTKTV